MVKYYNDKQIQWLRENKSLIHLSSGVYYTTQASIHPSTDTRKPVPGCLSSPHAAVQMHTVVHTPRLGTYSWLRAASCPPCVPALSWLSPSTAWGSQSGSWLSLCNHACSKKIIAKSATQCQQKIIFHGNSWFVKCKVHWIQLLTWAEKKESICRSSRRLPWNLAGKKYFRYLGKGGGGGGVRTNSVEPSLKFL